MFGNGVTIGTMSVTTALVQRITRSALHQAPTVLFGAARGTTTAGTSVPPTVTSTRRPTATAPAASALPEVDKAGRRADREARQGRCPVAEQGREPQTAFLSCLELGFGRSPDEFFAPNAAR